MRRGGSPRQAEVRRCHGNAVVPATEFTLLGPVYGSDTYDVCNHFTPVISSGIGHYLVFSTLLPQ